MPAEIPTIETLDADGRAEWEAEQQYMTEQYGHKIEFSEIDETPARDNIKYFMRREGR